MTDIYKANDNQPYKSYSNSVGQNAGGQVVLPLPPENIEAKTEMEIYARFMRHLRVVPNKHVEMKILAAIQFTADLLVQSDEYVAKILVDLGLRAPMHSFPRAYVEFISDMYRPHKWQVETKINSAQALKAYWYEGRINVMDAPIVLPIFPQGTVIQENL